MQTLRNARSLARFVLLWFALALGAAVASPLVRPQSVQLVCTGSGAVKVLSLADDGTVQSTGHLLDCPLCVVAGAPPPERPRAVQPRQPLSRMSVAVRVACPDARCAPPLPPRGPPAVS